LPNIESTLISSPCAGIRLPMPCQGRSSSASGLFAVEIDQQHRLFAAGQGGGEVQRRGGLAHPALLVEHGNAHGRHSTSG